MPRRCKVDGLPPRLKVQLERMLADRSHGGYEALSTWLAEHGYSISGCTIYRYDVSRVQAAMDRIRASTEAARLLAQSVPDEADEHSAAVLRMVQSALFGVMMQVAEAGETTDPEQQLRVLSMAARAIADASRASIGQKKWADEVKQRIDDLERAAQKSGKRLDAETLAAIREGLYGG